MPTSGVITGEINAQEVMIRAMEDLGVLGAGEQPTAEEYESMLPRLNWMLKSWQAKGCNLWRTTTGSITIAAGTPSGTLDPDIIDVKAARVVYDGTEMPIQRWEEGEYRQIPRKLNPGRPTAFYVDKQRDETNLYVWPVPTVNTVLMLDYARVIEDVTDATQTLDVPQQWAETVWKCLAVRCATLFGATRLDPTTLGELKQQAAILEQELLDMDRPASVFMGPAYETWF